ncbi:four helix bundle protein [Salegentibacter flavus]|uniref:Four helix bundle protein n=1 Tax=Salegentibacter flavus TaxID=287099 RepID=A0A1I4Y5K6_9FLAO|nr:four helix bundle protein [Salegentibacter flavus]SFN33326.1 hypothetical protein SAMN05660413_00544 [Salegentibacter flavus]
MAKVEHFEDLEVWQLGREICKDVEELFISTSLGKRYKLRDQMDRLPVLFPLMKKNQKI